MDRQKYLNTIDEVIANGKFKDNWDSLSEYEAPKWYRDAKLGIFIHWGVYSVPAFGSEWYSRNMYVKDSSSFKHHVKTYGPHKDFGYKDFIPMFKAEKFNADEWMNVFKESGAKYVMPVAEHHDGFQMYESELSHFNSVEMGPKKDILGELKKSADEAGIVFCASSHRAEHWFFMSGGKEYESDMNEPLALGDLYWPSLPEEAFGKEENADIRKEYLEDWLLRCCEIVDKYQPRIVYFDWWIETHEFKPYLKKFVAYYYNRAEELGYGAAVNYKFEALLFGCGVVDFERGSLKDLKPFFWQVCTSVSKSSWSYTPDNAYKTSTEIICDLVDVVSKNGTMLLNVGPKADGTLPDDDKRILLEIGDWMKVNGESIYGTNFWKIFGEGPTDISEGHMTDSRTKIFTSADIRFTTKGSYLYATVLSYPEYGIVTIKALSSTSKHFHVHGIIKSVEVLGFDEKPEFERTERELVIKTKNVKSQNPVVFKMLIE